MADPTGLAKIIEVSEKLTREAREFLFKIAGNTLIPASEELGEWFRDIIRVRRARWEKTINEAQRKAKSTKRPIQEVDVKILEPIIEGASLEGDETVSDLWSGLLASASIGETIDPIYSQILRDMTSNDAITFKLLNEIECQILSGQIKKKNGIRLNKKSYAIRIKSIRKESSLSDEELQISLEKLLNFGVCRLVGGTLRNILFFDEFKPNEGIYLTFIGKKFLDLCTSFENET